MITPDDENPSTRTEDPRSRFMVLAVVSSAVVAVVWLMLFATGRVEIGVPGEWVWARQSIFAIADVAVPIVVALTVCCGYLFAVRLLSQQLYLEPRRSWLIVPLVAVMGFFVLWSIQSCAPSPHRQIKPNWVLYDWGASGYFVDAASLPDLETFLSGFEEEMRKGEVLHKGTHPPGLVMANYALLRLCRENPSVANAILELQPKSVAEAFAELVPKQKLTTPDRAALWLSILLTHVIAALTILPLYGLLRRELNSEVSLLLASLWPLVPGLSVFLPKSDAIYPFVGSLFLWLILSSWEKGSIFRAAMAGLAFWLGMMLSLAMLPIAVIATVHAGLRLRTDFPGPTQALKSILGVIAAFAVTTIAFYLWSDIKLWNTWILNYQNHAGFYQQFDRTYTKWILANPLELTLTLGSPLLVLTVAGVASIVHDRSQFSRYVTPLAVMVVWSLLWLSGKNMGEAA
ncbi:MAG: hypothetical protein AB8G99_16840, partial [Planctomycetaceae bacterium]